RVPGTTKIQLLDDEGNVVDLDEDGYLAATGTEHKLTLVGDDIVFRARRIGTVELENLLPGFGSDKKVEIDIGANAALTGERDYLITQAEDRSFTELLGVNTVGNKYAVQPLTEPR